MNNNAVYITSEAPEWTSLDYKKLREAGIAFIQQYSGKEWTDFNHHDPGVTLLEYLCFGITDLGYRCNLPITDFLYATENHRLNPVNNAFFLPEKIFPCAPLNPDDYRKIILDHFDAVENVWLTPLEDQQDGLQGLYKILIQLREDSAQEKVRDEVHRLLCAHRNLCEDVEHIEILKEEPVDISATVELEHDAVCEQVLAEMLLKLIHYFTPPVKMLSFESMEAEGARLEDIFDGPEPTHGFIKTSSLKPRPVVAYLSLIKEIMISTPGVKNVGDLVVRINDIRQYKEEIKIRENTYLGLSKSMMPRQGAPASFRFLRNDKQVEPVAGIVTQNLNSLLARDARRYNFALNIPQPAQTSNKDLRDIGAYYSIQRFFPTVYGIGPYGHPQHFTPFQKTNALRLKGYLACMESLFADFVNNLTRLKHLFAISTEAETGQDDAGEQEEHPDRSDLNYLKQTLADIPDMEALWPAERQTGIEDPERALKRKQSALLRHHQFTDHLLARFGESIELPDQKIKSREEQLRQMQRLLLFKQKILQDYPDLSRNRGLGFNYRPDKTAAGVLPREIRWETQSFQSWESSNVSGLKKRLCHWLNIADHADHGLTDFQPLTGLFDHWKADPGAPIPPEQAVPLRPLLRHRNNPDHFEIKADETEYGVSVIYKAGADRSYTLFKAPDEQAGQEKIAQLKSALSAMNEHSQGFFIVEHLLLRPQTVQGRKFQVKIRLGAQELVFQSLEYDTLDNMERLADTFLMVASLETNYEVVAANDHQYFLLLKKGPRPFLLCTTLDGNTQVNKWRTDMVTLVNETMNKAPEKINDWISFPVQNIKGKNIILQAYNHQISIVLPNWVDRFSHEEGKAAFELLAKKHVPAHIKIAFRWLPWHKMQGFEKAYKQWLEAKAALDPDDESGVFNLDQLAFDLAQQLELPQSENLNEQMSGKSEQINKGIIDALFRQMKYNMLFPPEQLTIFEGIDKQIEAWLKNAMVYNWGLLASLSSAKQLELYRNFNLSGMELENWINQAAFAAAGKWEELEAYQAQLPGGRVKIRELAEKKLQLLYSL